MVARAIRTEGPALDSVPAVLRNGGMFCLLWRDRTTSLLGRHLRPWLEGPCRLCFGLMMKGRLYVGKEYRGFRSRRRGGRMETVGGGERVKARVIEVLVRVM